MRSHGERCSPSRFLTRTWDVAALWAEPDTTVHRPALPEGAQRQLARSNDL